jgi:hypothetical protein
MCTMLTSMPGRAEAKASVAAGIGMSPWHADLCAADPVRFLASESYTPRGSECVAMR